jgi:hypothetical protein
MRLRLAVLLCSLAVPAFAAPDVNSASFILLHCRVAQQLDKPPGFMASSTNAQQQRAVVLYAEKHPERLHENFKHFVVEALRETWPCP